MHTPLNPRRRLFQPDQDVDNQDHSLLLCNWHCRHHRNSSRGGITIAFVASLLLFLITSCQQVQIAPTKPVTISIAGATAMRLVLVDLSTEFSRQQPYVQFDITGGNSTIGEERVRLGQVDLAASTLISPAITSALTTGQQRKPLLRIPIGLDGLAVITHRSNVIENLTLIQLQELYSGHVWKWQDLGGANAEVLLITREDGSGSRTLFDERVMGKNPVALTAIVMPTSEDVVDYVSRHEGAVGYVSRAFLIDLLRANPTDAATPTTQSMVRVLQIENQLPTDEALQTQSYFFIQPLYLVSNGQPHNAVKQFIDFALSPAGQAIVAHYHYPIR